MSPEGESCSAACAVLVAMAWIQRTNDERAAEIDSARGSYPGMVTHERATLAWEFRARWHGARGLDFNEPPPKSPGERELERLDLMGVA